MAIGPLILALVLAGLAVGLVTAVGNVLATRARLECERHDLLRRVAELRQNHVERLRARRAEILARQKDIVSNFTEVDILDDEPLAEAA